MLEKQDEIRKTVCTVTEILKADKLDELIDILNSAQLTLEQTGYDNWNGGTSFYTIKLLVDIGTFVKIRDRIQSVQSDLLEKFSIATRHYENEGISNITIVPKAEPKINWTKLGGTISKEQLIQDIGFLKTQ